MALNRNDVVELVGDQLRTEFYTERARLDLIHRWYRDDPEEVPLPAKATSEHRKLAELAKTPWLGLVVNVMSQATYAAGFRSPDTGANARVWRTWQGNDLDARQVAIHRAAYGYGYAYASVLPGQAPDGAPMSRIRGLSPRRLQAWYADPAEDEWPMYALQIDPVPRTTYDLIRFYDEENVWTLTTEGGLQYVDVQAHGAHVCPIVRYASQLDLEGTATGEVEPFIPLAAKINKTDFDRLLLQHFQSWQIRYATGLSMPADDEAANAEAARRKLQLRHDDILIAEDPDSKFGVLPASPLDGMISAKRADVETLAAVSQTPTFALTGDLINLSADALASARAQLDQKLAERKVTLGRSHGQALRLAALLEGDTESAYDVMARVRWLDTSIRSLATAADALGKLAQMLGVPVQALWSRIPGVDESDVLEWQRLSAQGDPLTALGDLLQRQAAAGESAAA